MLRLKGNKKEVEVEEEEEDKPLIPEGAEALW
jgi:hypothetical protein